MKKFILPVLALSFIAAAFTTAVEDSKTSLAIGSKAPMANTKMKDVKGGESSLNDLKKENGLLVIFSCNTCPFVVGGSGLGEGWHGRYNDIQAECDKNNVGMVLVNSNEAKRDGDDSFKAMQAHAKKHKYASHYVVDKNSAMANAFNAKTTPHVFLFDKNMKLVYKGAIDDNNKSASEVKEHWLSNAIMKMKKGEKIDPAETRNKGCSIKRVKK